MGMYGWLDSKNEFVLFSFCERQFSTLTSYWRTTWVDNMNANKIGKKKHQYEQIEAGGFGRRIKLDLTGYVSKGTTGKRQEREKERELFFLYSIGREKTGFIIEKSSSQREDFVKHVGGRWCRFFKVASEDHLLKGKRLSGLCTLE